MNKVDGGLYLEFAVHLLDLGYFNPVVFSHDKGWFNREQYAQVVIGFTNLLSFLYSCGLTIDTEVQKPDDVEAELYRAIMRDEDLSGLIRCYILHEVDFTDLNMENASVPDSCKDADFALVRTYLLLRAGAALTRKSMESIFQKRLTDSEATTIRKQLRVISNREIRRRKDNSFEMR